MPETQRTLYDFLATPEAYRLGLATGQNGLEALEAQNQHSFTENDTLPVQMSAVARLSLEQSGVVFGDPVPENDLLVCAKLPEGWSKVPDPDNSLFSYLVDDKGRKRGSMKYKVAPDQRQAYFSEYGRFNIRFDRRAKNVDHVYRYFVTDGDVDIYAAEPRPFDDSDNDDYDRALTSAKKEVTDWLNEHYPAWNDRTAYWND